MSRDGVAILMSTHTLEVAQEMCDRISIILGGRIIARGTVDELRALAGTARRPADARVPQAHRRRGLPRDRAVTHDRSPGCCCRASGRRATARAGARGATARARPVRRRSASAVAGAIFAIVFWLTWQLLDYEELGDYLLRLGLGWLFLTFLSFVAFSAVVSSLSTFFLSEDLRLLLPAPVPPRAAVLLALHAAPSRSPRWMVVAFVLPVLLAVGLARCAPSGYYLTAAADGRAVRRHPCGSRRSRHARPGERVPRPPRPRRADADGAACSRSRSCCCCASSGPSACSSVQSLPDVTAFFATLQSPVTPFLPSFWAGESLFAGLRGRHRPAAPRRPVDDGARRDDRRARGVRPAVLRRLEQGPGGPQGALHAARLAGGGAARAAAARLCAARCWSRTSRCSCATPRSGRSCCCCVALALVYVYNFRALDLDRIPYMSRVIKNAYAFVNLAMAAFVTSAVAVRFVFPAVSAEGHAFWIVRTRAGVGCPRSCGRSSGPACCRSCCWPRR